MTETLNRTALIEAIEWAYEHADENGRNSWTGAIKAEDLSKLDDEELTIHAENWVVDADQFTA